MKRGCTFLKYGLYAINENYSLVIIPIADMNNCYTEAYPDENKNVVKKDVYEGKKTPCALQKSYGLFNDSIIDQ